MASLPFYSIKQRTYLLTPAFCGLLDIWHMSSQHFSFIFGIADRLFGSASLQVPDINKRFAWLHSLESNALSTA